MNKTKPDTYLSVTSLYIALAIILGAFGAHALKDQLSAYHLQVYQTANFYQFISGFSCFLILLTKKPFSVRAFYLNLTGGLIFSISLYLLSIFDLKFLGMITPVGGTLMIIAWLYFTYRLLKPI